MDFPCAVYTRIHASQRYKFSHFCNHQVQKTVPDSLHASSLVSYFGSTRPTKLDHEFALVLVGGDVAQGVSLENMHHSERRQRFLYCSSKYQSPCATRRSSDLESDYIEMKVYSTMSFFNQGVFSDSLQVLVGIMVLPTELHDNDLARFHEWLQSLITKSIQGSRWITETGCYLETNGARVADFKRD